MIVDALERCLETLSLYDFSYDYPTEEDLTEEDRKDLQLIVNKSREVLARLNLSPNEKKKLAILSLVRKLDIILSNINYLAVRETKDFQVFNTVADTLLANKNSDLVYLQGLIQGMNAFYYETPSWVEGVPYNASRENYQKRWVECDDLWDKIVGLSK